MAHAAAANRRSAGRDSARRARRRRSKVLAIALIVALAGLLAFQVPHTLKLLGNGESSTAAVPSTAATSSPKRSAPKKLPANLRSSAVDPFGTGALPNLDPRVRPGGGRDPFAARLPSTLAVPATAPALPKRLVIGTPGAHKRLIRGWIVILASIPIQRGRAAATSFARKVHGLGDVSILNSSRRRPLRGGYWVVYTGPVKKLSIVSGLAATVHAAGYRSAYIRELFQYR